ncbi:MAG: diguanylate cyclase (GGDEF)-like protein/PAS domain S-box-containing protein [Gammaproteobacteria bacterium]|jgi:diguanylate cyclase (GGDEF)-like protein/PAS domain S-box-containing protein
MSTIPSSPKLSGKELRAHAEALLKKQTDNNQILYSEEDTKKLLHELQVHQIELEIQNVELREARVAERLHYSYTELFEFAPIAYFAFDKKSIINQVNLRGASLLGIERGNLERKQFSNYVTIQHRDKFKRCLAKVFDGEGAQTCEILVQANNTTRWLSIEANLGLTGTHCLAAFIDVTDRKKAEDDRKLAASVFTHAGDGIAITDGNAVIIDVNESYTLITGFSREEAIGQNLRFLESRKEAPQVFSNIWQVLQKDGYWFGEMWNRRKNGEEYAEMTTISAVYNEQGVATHYIALANDITSMKDYQTQLEQIAHYDVLTNLPNRALLTDLLSIAMQQCSVSKRSIAVVLLDLDGFKVVNDAYGHDVGDELLITLSVRMKGALREGDTLARIGGDEFVAVLADLTNIDDAEPVFERLLLAASEPATVGGVVVNVSASIGVTIYPQDGVNAEQLLRHADQAMYVAKKSGKNCYHLFDIIQDDAFKLRRENLAAIRRAIDNHEFVLYYQPKVNMRTGTVFGVEALIYWQHPKLGLLNPIEFLPVVEHNPMMVEIGEWVIDTALRQISTWQEIGHSCPIHISVNIAAVQLQQPNFTQRLTKLLAAHPDIEPRFLELEVLETSALDNVYDVSATMNDCKALGVSFALDDFGTGYSSLTYLRRLPVSVIKIDMSFVRDMLTNTDDLSIVEGVIGLAKSFKRDVIAEGVESVEHGCTLLQLGCDLAQGYGIAKPMPATDILTWIKGWKPDASWLKQK